MSSRPRRRWLRWLRWLRLLCPALGLAALGSAAAQPAYPGIGRVATAAEVKAWDTDVRPDFRGLPAGSGAVAQGQLTWEARCASCHGVFGENNAFFAPLVGGSTRADVQTGRVARLNDASYPGRTTLMKLSTLSTLWDYINRAMPWNAPRSLSTDEVYGVTAYLLYLGDVLPDDFVLSDTNIATVQARLPNRNGVSTSHGLWPGRGLGNGGKPDVRALACMNDCADAPTVGSVLPDFARNSHGNLAEQQRSVGPQRGVDTSRPAPSADAVAKAAAAPARPGVTAAIAPSMPAAALALLQQHNCTACHGLDRAIIGPGFSAIAGRYRAQADRAGHLAARIASGSQGVWGSAAMPAQVLPESDLQAIVAWLARGADE